MDSLIASGPTVVIGNAITFGYYLPQLHDMVANIGTPDMARITHHTSNDLLIKQDTICNRQGLGCPVSVLPSDLINVSRPGQLCIVGRPDIPSCIQPRD